MQIKLNRKTKESLILNMVQVLPVLRAGLGVTQAELAERIGVTRQTLTAIENGSRKLSWSGFLALCFIFDGRPETRPMLELYEICPDMLRNYLKFI